MKNDRLLVAAFLSMFMNMIVANEVSSSIGSLPYPYNTLTTLLPFDGHGFCNNGTWIEKLMTHNKVLRAIEIGSWLGFSTRNIASLLQSGGTLYAVDTWQGSVEHCHNPEWSGKLPTLYQQFLSNVIHAGLTDKIVPIQAKSLDAVVVLRSLGTSFDLIYLDAAHDTDAVYNDLVAYFPFVDSDHGIFCGDDWWWESVRVAVIRFAQEHDLTVYSYYNWSNFWFLKKEGKYQHKDFSQENDSAWTF